jgi:hypothetical protein
MKGLFTAADAAENAEVSQRGEERMREKRNRRSLFFPSLCETSAFCGVSAAVILL